MKKSMTDISGRFSWTDGQMIQATSGKVLSDSNWIASDYVDISDCDFIEIKTANTATKTSTIGLAFYDANKNYISGVVHTDKSGVYGILIHELEVPENAVYIRSTYYSKNHSNYKDEFGEFYCMGYVADYTEPTGHSLGEWYLHKAPTTSEAGEERRDCANCDYYESREVPAYKVGDINRDGKVNTIDANYARRYAAGLLTLDAGQKLAGDVNLDGEVNVMDSAFIRRHTVKLINVFPAEEAAE